MGMHSIKWRNGGEGEHHHAFHEVRGWQLLVTLHMDEKDSLKISILKECSLVPPPPLL
jgi:hypothetical protein